VPAKKTAKKTVAKPKSVTLTQEMYDALLHHTHRMAEDSNAPTWAQSMTTAEPNP